MKRLPFLLEVVAALLVVALFAWTVGLLVGHGRLWLALIVLMSAAAATLVMPNHWDS